MAAGGWPGNGDDVSCRGREDRHRLVLASHILVCNAGILRDRPSPTPPSRTGAGVKVHLKGTLLHHAGLAMRDNASPANRHDSPTSGLCGNSASPTGRQGTWARACFHRGASGIRVMGLAPAPPATRLPAASRSRRHLPENIAPGVLTWSRWPPTTGKVLGVSSRGAGDQDGRPMASTRPALHRPGGGRTRRRGVLPPPRRNGRQPALGEDGEPGVQPITDVRPLVVEIEKIMSRCGRSR